MSSESQVKVESSRGLLARKIAVGFGIGALSYAVPETLSILDAIRDGEDVALGTALFISLASGTCGAAIRAALALGPFNLAGPTDALHTIGREKMTTVVVDDDAEHLKVEVEDTP